MYNYKLITIYVQCHTVTMVGIRLLQNLKLRQFNNVLTGVVIILGLYIVLSPFLPAIVYKLHKPHIASNTLVQVAPSHKLPATPIPDDEELKIPRLNMTEVIHTGPSMYELNKGVWLVPHTSAPDLASNTVIIGHRFTYAGPAVFYFLDKIEMNDRITIDWQHKEYTYKVTAISVVPPADLAVQNATPKPQLTLYTCTPLITAKNRLVITAPLIGVRS